MRYSASALSALLLCALVFPSFSLLYMANGSADADSGDYFSMSQPISLYLSGDTLFATDSGRGRLYLFNASDSLSRIKVVQSPSSEDFLSNPMHMDYDFSSGIIYIAGGTSGNVLLYSGVGSTVDKWNPLATTLQKASSVALSDSTFYVADATRGQILAFSRATKAYSNITVQSGGSDGLLSSPQDIEFHDGKYYVSDSSKGLIFVYDSNFAFLNKTIGRGKGDVTLSSPRGIDFDSDRLYVADASANRVVVFSLDGYPVDILNSSTEWGNLSYPEDVAVYNGTLFVADTGNRLVKAFKIAKAAGDLSVQQMIVAANTTCASLSSMQAVASNLNASYSAVSYAADIASAQSYYDAYQFSSASSLASKAKSDCASAQSSLTQEVELKIKQLLQSSQAKVAPYRNLSSNGVSLLVQFDNKAATVNFALSSKSYSAAATSALSLPSLADAIVNASESKVSTDAEKKKNQSLALANADITAVLGRISSLQAKSDQYHQGLNLSGSRALLELARQNAQNNDFESANRSLELALIEISSYEATLDSAAKDINAALSSLALLEFEFNSTLAKPILFAPDISKEKAMMAHARESVYASPQLALQTAGQAKASAEAKSRDSQAISLAAISVLVVLFFIALIAAGFLVHIWGKRKKGL